MSQIINELHQDHLNVVRLLDFMESTVERVDIYCREGVQLCFDITHYLTHYTDIFHHPKEDYMFSLLEKRDSSIHNTILQLKNEHERLVEKGSELLQVLQHALLSEDFNIEELEHLIYDYANTLRKHMLTEEMQVFSLAKLLLTDDDDKKIQKQCSTKLDPVFGDAAHIQYERLEKLIAEELQF